MFVKDDEFHIWDAVVAWRDHIYQADFFNNTKGNYLTGMLKLIQSDIIDIRLKLNKVDEGWATKCKQNVDDNPNWSVSIKSIRKSIVNSFFNFIHTSFDYTSIPYRRNPKPNEIKHILSNVQEKALTKDISPIELCNALSKINERDAYVIWLMMSTGQPLKAILERRKENLRTSYICKDTLGASYMDFDENGEYIPPHIAEWLIQLSKKSTIYLFETAKGKKIRHNQITRNLKQAGRNIGLDFDLTPKLLHGYVNAYMSRDKRSELEKALYS